MSPFVIVKYGLLFTLPIGIVISLIGSFMGIFDSDKKNKK